MLFVRYQLEAESVLASEYGSGLKAKGATTAEFGLCSGVAQSVHLE